jgi:Zn-dependent protease with chaperone function
MINPPLIVVSALFFLALSSVLYVGAWLSATTILRLRSGRISHAAAKRVLMTALVLPPVLALVPTLSGATLHHVHDAAVLEHHSMMCRDMFLRVLSGQGVTERGGVREITGAVTSGGAWLLVLTGLFLVAKLFRATVRLGKGLHPYQSAPSPRLSQALGRVSKQLSGHFTHRFYECPIPATYSSVVGFWRARCVLSRDFVESATEDELDAVVAHEVSHLRAGDVRATFLVGALNCFFFYLRPVRLLGRRWREEAELACDDTAVSATRQPLAMAAAILRASGIPVTTRATRPLPAVTLAFADEAACSPSKRVERLLAQAQEASLPSLRETPAHAFAGWAVTFLFAALGVTVLLSAEAACYAHCSLEAIARVLH